jgi:hypothetical protein
MGFLTGHVYVCFFFKTVLLGTPCSRPNRFVYYRRPRNTYGKTDFIYGFFVAPAGTFCFELCRGEYVAGTILDGTLVGGLIVRYTPCQCDIVCCSRCGKFQCFCRSQCCLGKSNEITLLLQGTWKNTRGDSVAVEASGRGGHTIGTIVLRSRVVLAPCSDIRSPTTLFSLKLQKSVVSQPQLSATHGEFNTKTQELVGGGGLVALMRGVCYIMSTICMAL